MQFTKDTAGSGKHLIRAYAPGRINVNDKLIAHSLILTPDKILEDWPPRSPEDITLEHLQMALALEPEVLIIGTGATLRFPDAAVTAEIQRRGIGLEVLDTAAACRTYNILVSEERKVVAALVMILN